MLPTPPGPYEGLDGFLRGLVVILEDGSGGGQKAVSALHHLQCVCCSAQYDWPIAMAGTALPPPHAAIANTRASLRKWIRFASGMRTSQPRNLLKPSRNHCEKRSEGTTSPSGSKAALYGAQLGLLEVRSTNERRHTEWLSFGPCGSHFRGGAETDDVSWRQRADRSFGPHGPSDHLQCRRPALAPQ